MRGRPTLDPKHFRVNLRINEETYRKLNTICEKTGVSLAEYVRQNIDGNDLGFSSEELKLLKDIFNMARLNGVSKKEFLRILDNELTQGTLIIENGMLKQERS